MQLHLKNITLIACLTFFASHASASIYYDASKNKTQDEIYASKLGKEMGVLIVGARNCQIQDEVVNHALDSDLEKIDSFAEIAYIDGMEEGLLVYEKTSCQSIYESLMSR